MCCVVTNRQNMFLSDSYIINQLNCNNFLTGTGSLAIKGRFKPSREQSRLGLVTHNCRNCPCNFISFRSYTYNFKMDKLKNNWFSESCDMWPGVTFSFEVKEVLHEEKSQFQNIQIFETKSLGRVLVLDGIIQCTQKDEFSYQEMISFLPLCCHKNPEKVLIVGGGDGGVAREVAKHPQVKEIVQVEIDARVIELSKKYLPFMAVGFDSPKLTLHVGDGFEFLKNHRQEFDVIITDSSDPVGPAVSLFEENYFSLMKKALKPHGIVCSQAGTIWYDLELVGNTLRYCRNQFPAAAYAYASVPSYPSGQIGFVIGSLDREIKFDTPNLVFSREEEKAMNLRYYNSEIHKAAFVLPTNVKYQLA